MNTQVVTVSSKFQVVIPQAVREQHGIRPGAKMAWIDFGQGLRPIEVKSPKSYRGIAQGLVNTDIGTDPEL